MCNHIAYTPLHGVTEIAFMHAVIDVRVAGNRSAIVVVEWFLGIRPVIRIWHCYRLIHFIGVLVQGPSIVVQSSCVILHHTVVFVL